MEKTLLTYYMYDVCYLIDKWKHTKGQQRGGNTYIHTYIYLLLLWSLDFFVPTSWGEGIR